MTSITKKTPTDIGPGIVQRTKRKIALISQREYFT